MVEFRTPTQTPHSNPNYSIAIPPTMVQIIAAVSLLFLFATQGMPCHTPLCTPSSHSYISALSRLCVGDAPLSGDIGSSRHQCTSGGMSNRLCTFRLCRQRLCLPPCTPSSSLSVYAWLDTDDESFLTQSCAATTSYWGCVCNDAYGALVVECANCILAIDTTGVGAADVQAAETGKPSLSLQ
jgi:hypothetical protein